MKILIIEDDQNKRETLTEVVKSCLPHSEISYARSQNSGLACLISSAPELVLLDMSMPFFDVGPREDGYQTSAFAGRYILHQLKRRKITTKVIVVTAFSRLGEDSDAINLTSLDVQLRETFSGLYLGYVHYNLTVDAWKSSLKQLLASVTIIEAAA